MRMEQLKLARQTRHAFTMVEVAIALAVIGFALVAIIGILPAGLNVQKENREESIINQDASIWMNAIRSGAEGMDYLTAYVDGIKITSTNFDSSGKIVGGSVFIYNRYGSPNNPLVNGGQIIGLLTTPKYVEDGQGGTDA